MLRSVSGKLVALAAVGAMVACNEVAVELPTPTTIQVSSATLSLFVGETGELAAQVLDQNGEVITGATVLWASDAPSVAQVDADGNVLARGAGAATVTASHGTATATVAVSVQNAATVQVVPGAIQLVATSSSQEVTARVLGAAGEAINTAVTWISLDPSVATVGASGTVEFVAPVSVGTTSIVAEALGAADTVPVQVVADRRTFITTLDILGPSTVTVDVTAANPALLQYSAQDGDGDEVCFATNALNVRASDPAVIAPAFAGNCLINLFPGAAGGSWVVLETNLVADSVWVRVTNIGYGVVVASTPDPSTILAGDTVSYAFIVVDEAGYVVPGVTLNFDVTAGELVTDQVQTDANGIAWADWRLPQFLFLYGANQTLSFRATYPSGAVSGTLGVNVTVAPNVADSIDFLFRKTTQQGFVFADTLADGGTADFMLGDGPLLYAQSYDAYGNTRQTNVVFSASNPQFIQDDDAVGTMEVVTLFANVLGAHRVTATEGAASATVTLNSTVGPEAVVRYTWSNAIFTVQPTLNTQGGNVTDTVVYNGATSTRFPTWTLRSDTLAFVRLNGGFWDVALVASDGSEANAPRSVLPAVNRASLVWGFPVFQTQSGNPAGALIYASNRDSTKVANNELTWDIYRFYRNSNFAEKLTTTVANSNFRYAGLALSPDQTKLLYVSTEGTNPDASTRYSQVYEMTLSTRSVRQITNNSNASTDYGYATYSPDGATIYIEASVGNETQLFAYDGSTFRLLWDDTFEGVQVLPYYQPSFNPTASNIMAMQASENGLGKGVMQFVDASDPQTVLGTGQTSVLEFSWSRR